MHDSRAVMRSLPLVASILGRRYGIQVQIGGTEAYTDGKTIHLPSLPVEDNNLLPLVRGYLDHEAGHVRETDFDVLREATLTPLEMHIWNIIEDWRIENKLASIFPGCRQNFDWLITHLFGSATPDVSATGDASCILNWMLLTVRCWDVPALSTERDTIASMVDAGFPGVRQRIAPLLNKVRTDCDATADAIRHARMIVQALRKQVAHSSPSANTQRKTTKKTTVREPSDGPAAVEEDSGHYTPERIRAMESLLEASEDTLPKTMGAVLAEALQQANSPSWSTAVAVEQPRLAYPLDADAIAQARAASMALKTRLHGLVQSAVVTRCATGRRGRLDPSRLHRLSVADGRLFRQRGERHGINTAAHILLDSSGSMSGCMTLASTACHATASALAACGVSVGLTAFPGHYLTAQANWASVSPLIRHGQRVHPKVNVTSGGGTPLAESLWWTMQTMLPLPESRKLILIITDGDPDSGVQAEEALVGAARAGFEVYGIGIISTAILSLLPGNSLVISSMGELAPAMFTLLQKAMLRRA